MTKQLSEDDLNKAADNLKDFPESPEVILVHAIQVKDIVGRMIREYDATKPQEEQDFDSAWNTALWALLDELGLGDD